MRKLHREATTPKFVPDYLARSLHEVDFEALREAGIKHIAFDADSTLVPFRGKVLSKKTEELLKEKRKLFDGWCIASNRITKDLDSLAASMDATVIQSTIFIRKPQRRFFDRVITHFQSKPHEIAMVGDKLVADMYGAKKSGLTTVWVEKIGPDSPWDRHLFHTRRWEQYLMRRYN